MSINPELWNAMKTAGGEETALRRLAEQATQEQLIHLHRQFEEFAAELASNRKFSSSAGNQNRALAAWIVSQGRKAYHDAERGLLALPTATPSSPDFDRVMRDVYRERFGDDIPDFEPDPSDDPSIRYDPSWDAKLWELIDVTRAGVPIAEAAARYTRRDLIQLQIALHEIVKRIEQRAAAKFGESESDDWLLWALWMIGQGEEAVAVALERASTRSEVPEDASENTFEVLLSSEYESRYGVIFPIVASRRGQ